MSLYIEFFTLNSDQKLHERHKQPAAVHFQWTLATKGIWHLSGSKQHNASDQSVALKLRGAQLFANEQRRHRSSSQLQTRIPKAREEEGQEDEEEEVEENEEKKNKS